MSVAVWILGLALSAAAGRLVLYTTLGGLRRRASTLEAVQGSCGAIEYRVAPLDLECRGNVVVRHRDRVVLGDRVLGRLRGLKPEEVVLLLRAEGFETSLVPGGERISEGAPDTCRVRELGLRHERCGSPCARCRVASMGAANP